jgi:nicotinamidase-related amidase
MKRILIVVDYQTDFVTGALANPAAAELEQALAARVQEALRDGWFVLFTRDTHTTDYLQTREGQFLPIPHCIKDTPGWHLQGALAQYETTPQNNIAFVDKPTFGCIALPAAVQELCGGTPDTIELCGVVTDICVVSNAIVLHSAFLDAEICVHGSLCASTTPEGHRRALDLLAGMGYRIIE